MGVEVKGAGDGVVIAERGCNDGCGCRDQSSCGCLKRYNYTGSVIFNLLGWLKGVHLF